MSPQYVPRSSDAREDVDVPSRPKSELYCQCGRTAALDEWLARSTPAGRELVCPDCGAVLTVR